MITNPIESSMISRVGYDPELNFLRAVMSDGSIYDCAPVPAADYAAFMASRSKGNYWHTHFAAKAFRAGKIESGGSIPVQLREPSPTSILETFAEDNCCSRRLQKASRAGLTQWNCPECGCDWEPAMVNGVKHWSPKPAFFVMPTGRP